MASTCEHCNAEIIWIETTAGKLMPCNPRGLTVITATGETVRGRESHFATCPGAQKHKKDKECDHPWHDNPALITFCPECRMGAATNKQQTRAHPARPLFKEV